MQTYVDTDGTLVIPGAAASWTVAPSASGTSTTGVVILVGEADSGPAFSADDVVLNGYGPSQKAAVVAKYGAGRLVDAYIQATKPSKDAGVRGAPQRIYLVKTNAGLQAEGLIGVYTTLQAKLAGINGNLISVEVKAHTDPNKRIVAISRKLDAISETFTVGGNIGLHVTSTTTAALAFTVTGTALTSAGNAQAAALNVLFSQFKTLKDMAAYISSKNGWTATVVAAFGQRAPSTLDQGTYTVHTGVTLTPVDVKMDAYEFITAVNGSRLAQVKSGVAPTAGLPVVAAPVFLSGGTRGSTTDANVTSALTEAERIKGNFVVPLFSQGAASDTDTDATSTYTIAGVNAALADHVSRMSQFKMKKPRQGFASILDTYANQKAAAQGQGFARLSMSFLDVQVSGQNGLAWFQPWMGAVTAAAMQAAAFYRPIFGKAININGARHHTAGQFTIENTDSMEDALGAGLLPIQERDGGGWEFTSDQTTYGADSNFVLNSIQAIYVADTISMTVATKMERAFKGQSFADVSPGVAMSFFKSVMTELRRLKLIKGTAAVPAGYKDALIDIQPPAMLVSAEVKAATGLYFVPIKFLITQSQESATA